MVKNLLVALGLSEMLAYVVLPSMKQLRDKMGPSTASTSDLLRKERPPRPPFSVRVVGLADKQI